MKKLLLATLAILALSCTSGNTLKVISYNVRTSAKDDGENSWINRKEATKAMLEEQQPDIFGVQEAQPDQLAYIAGECPDYIPFGLYFYILILFPHDVSMEQTITVLEILQRPVGVFAHQILHQAGGVFHSSILHQAGAVF